MATRGVSAPITIAHGSDWISTAIGFGPANGLKSPANEADAYTAESLAMTLVDGLLTRCGQGPLTNAISGHHQGVRRVGESDLGGVASWEGRFRMERVDIGSRQLDIEAAVPASVP